MSSGPAVRKREARPMANGLTLLTHANGSLTNIGSSGRHWPTTVPGANEDGTSRPSVARFASILAATVAPIEMPAFLRQPPGIVASEAVYAASRFALTPSGRAGTSPTSTWCAAVATAAALDAEREGRGRFFR